MKLTVIVPVCSTEESILEKSLEYIFDSSLKNLEVIVVNFGEAKKYDKAKRKFLKADFFDIEGDELKAKCEGIKKATGDYIYFAEPHSRVFFDYLEGLTAKAMQEKYDIVLGDWAIQTKSFAYKLANDYTIKKSFYAEDDGVLDLYFSSRGGERSWFVLWNKIIKTEILKSVVADIDKIEGDKLFDSDRLITFLAFSKAKNVGNVHLGLYFKYAKNAFEYFGETKEELSQNILKLKKTFDFMESNLTEREIIEDFNLNLMAWRRLTETLLFRNAKRIGHKELVEDIKTIFGEGVKVFLSADAKYAIQKSKMLPKNLNKIEDALKKACFSNKYIKVYAKNETFAFFELVQMKRLLTKRYDITLSKIDANLVVPSQKLW